MTPAQAKKWIGVAGLLVTTMGAAFAGLQLSQPTDVAEQIHMHDVDEQAHAPIREQLGECIALGKRIDGLQGDQRALGARLVRVLAADSEREPRKRAQAASEAQEEYWRLLRAGASLEDALLGAVRYRRTQ